MRLAQVTPQRLHDCYCGQSGGFGTQYPLTHRDCGKSGQCSTLVFSRTEAALGTDEQADLGLRRGERPQRRSAAGLEDQVEISIGRLIPDPRTQRQRRIDQRGTDTSGLLAGTDGNFILTGAARLIEIQMSAEGATFSRDEMGQLMDLAEAGCAELVNAQKAALA